MSVDIKRSSRWWQISLRRLLLGCVLVVLGASHLYTSYSLQRAREENRLLRLEIGRFPVEDASRLHIAALDTVDRLTWRWKVFVPSNGKYVLRTEVVNLPESGLPTPLGQIGTELPAGEFILTVTANQERDGEWMIVTMVPHPHTRVRIPATNATWLNKIDIGVSQLGRDGVTMIAPEDAPVLLRARKSKAVPGGVTVDMKPTDGVMVWIEQR
jgi:hypothetical protein